MSRSTPTPTINVAVTNAVGTQFANMMTQTAMAFTPTPVPTMTPMPTATNIPLLPNDLDSNIISFELMRDLGYSLECQFPENYSRKDCKEAFVKMKEYQNQYNEIIVNLVASPDGAWLDHPELHSLLARLIKRQILNESHFVPTLVTGGDDIGLLQIDTGTLNFLLNNNVIDAGRAYDLYNPSNNIEVGLANLRYLYDSIKLQNLEHGWGEMSDEDALKFALVMHNAGPNAPWWVFGTPESYNNFWSPVREKIVEGAYGDCANPSSWDCFKVVFPYYRNLCTAPYVDNIFSNDINQGPRDIQGCQ
jgi:hypothetical protein